MSLKLTMTSVLLVVVSACYSMADYRSIETPELRFEDPDSFRAKPADYPKYRTTRSVKPPNEAEWVPEIKPDDIWVVRYRVGDLYLIFSESYHIRTCQARAARRQGFLRHSNGVCSNVEHFDHVWITPDGSAMGDMLQIKNPAVVLFRGDRMRVMKPDHRFDSEWGLQPLFKRVE